MTLTTIDDDLATIIEPNVSVTSERIRTLNLMKEAGIPTVVWICPLLPMINDTVENVRGLLDACVRASVKGIVWFGAGMTLREGNREYFYKALDRHFPGLSSHYEHHYGNRYSIRSENHPILDRMVKETCNEHGIMHDPDEVFAYMRTLPGKHPFTQLSIDDL
jgi:DNA repair photolyase